jgi:hypothetical protein
MSGSESRRAQASRPSKRLGSISARTGKPVKEPSGGKVEEGRVFQAAARTAEFFDHLRTHYRETRRTPVEIEATVKLLLADGTVYDVGRGVIRDLSPSGALLTQIRLTRNSYPVAPFTLELILRGGKHEGIGISAVPVRFAPDGLGVRFSSIFVAA